MLEFTEIHIPTVSIADGGNAAYSVMANTLRGIYGTDVLIATGNSFTGNVLKAGYTEKMAGRHDHAKWSFGLQHAR